MTKAKRIKEIIAGIVILIFVLFINIVPEDGANIVVLVVSMSLLFGGIRLMHYYITMARHMNDGERVLYRAILMLDLGIFAVVIATIPQTYILLYLLGYNIFLGVVDILRALETKKITAYGWKLKLVLGIVTCIVSVVGFFNIHSPKYFVAIYSTGLIISAIGRITGALRKTAIVYIQ